MRTKQWTTRDGSKIRVMDMEDSHLVNTIHFLQKFHEAETLRDINLPEPRGDMAQLCWEDEQQQILAMDVADRVPIYIDMINEANKRKLAYKEHYFGKAVSHE